MKFLLLIYENEAPYADGAALETMITQHRALAGSLAAEGVLRDGAGLAASPTARTVRTRQGRKTVNDGPFAEAREQLGGYYVIEVANIEAALAIAQRVPLFEDGAIEVRALSA